MTTEDQLMSSDSLLRVTEEGDRTAVQFAPRTSLTDANAADFARAVAGLVDGRDRPNLSFDLAAVEFLGSVGLSQFIGLNRRVRAAGGRLKLVNLKPAVRQVFAVTRLDTLLDVEPRSLPA
jgi:anti-anti-sigma factor